MQWHSGRLVMRVSCHQDLLHGVQQHQHRDNEWNDSTWGWTGHSTSPRRFILFGEHWAR